MEPHPPLCVRRAETRALEPTRAVAELWAQLGGPALAGVLFFASSRYDLDALGRAVRARFDGPVAGCTTAGNIGPAGYAADGITAVSLAGDGVRVRSHLVAPLERCESLALAVAKRVERERTRAPGWRRFGLLWVDGLALAEERLTATLHHACDRLPIVGGSAGDELRFADTRVYFEGEMLANAGVLTVVETVHPFTAVQLQHVAPTATKLVVTSVDVERRVVHELDGERAADVYAERVGVRPDALDATVFSKNPLVLQVGGAHYVRSVRAVLPDGGLQFFCALEEGTVVSLGRSTEPLRAAADGLARASSAVGGARLVIGFDCVLRRLELAADGLADEMGALYARHGVVGFSTYGEQVDAMHVNQTFAGLALGA